MRRREFLGAALGSAWAAPLPYQTILVHEHVLVDFRGPGAPANAYDPDEVFRIVKPHLEAIKKQGCRRFQDCTPNFLGRNAKLLTRLADATGLEIWTNTGLYSARAHKYLPDYAKTETPEQLAARWTKEWKTGVDGMKPRFIKIGVNRGPLDELDRKIVHAAALCSKQTGLTAVSHTGNGLAAKEQVAIFEERKADPSRFVWVHADGEKDHSFHEAVARAGAWVEFDHVGPTAAALNWHQECVEFMAAKGLLGHVMISQDAGYYRVGESGGGRFNPYDTIYTQFAPRLKTEQLKQLLVDNPVKAFNG